MKNVEYLIMLLVLMENKAHLELVDWYVSSCEAEDTEMDLRE